MKNGPLMFATAGLCRPAIDDHTGIGQVDEAKKMFWVIVVHPTERQQTKPLQATMTDIDFVIENG